MQPTLPAGTAPDAIAGLRRERFDLEALAPIAARVGPTVDELDTPLDSIPAGATSPAFFRP